MGYTIESKQSETVEAVLSTSEKSFAVGKLEDQTLATKPLSKNSAEVYFQIED
jgi:hypothetical protein